MAFEMILSLAVALLVLHCGITAGQVIIIDTYAGKNLNAPLSVLDASSLQPPHAAVGSIRVDKELKCQLLCMGYKGCNAYTFCNQTTGCTGFCDSYTSANPMLGGTGTDNYQNAPLPINNFGKFVYPGSTTGCMPGDSSRWPWGMCSLKSQTPDVAPAFYSGSAADGWTSGIIRSSIDCRGLPFALCEACYSLQSDLAKQQCMNCAVDVYSQTGASNLNKATAGWYCLWCINPRQNTTTCNQCLKENTATGLPYLCV